MKAPLAGGAPVVLADNRKWEGDIVRDGSTLYWLEKPGNTPAVMKMPIAGGAPTQVAVCDAPIGGQTVIKLIK